MEDITEDTSGTTFWRRRVLDGYAKEKNLHCVVWDYPIALWKYSQEFSAQALKSHVRNGDKILDAGCGYGAMVECINMAKLTVDYTGIDISPELIEIAGYRYPGRRFAIGDITKLSYEDSHFDWVIIRSCKNMTTRHHGDGEWMRIWNECRRVGKNVMHIDYPMEMDETPKVLINEP